MWIYIAIGAAAFIIFAVLLTSYICFLRVFRSPKNKDSEGFELPPGEVYVPYRRVMEDWYNRLLLLDCEDFAVRSFDGLTLRGRYYECIKGAPVELMFHGYQGNSVRDLSGGVFRAFALGRNALIIDHRGSGRSDGKVITFGINESRDCLAWIDFAISHFGSDVKLILTGISMGAATVAVVSGEALPENVRYILCDCPYSSAGEIIKKVIDDMRLPSRLLYPFVRLGARIYGRFSLECTSPIEAVKVSRTPIIFFHGDTDDFVPSYMSEKLYEACASEKKLVIVPGAGHGLAYPADCESYLAALREFDKLYL